VQMCARCARSELREHQHHRHQADQIWNQTRMPMAVFDIPCATALMDWASKTRDIESMRTGNGSDQSRYGDA